LEAGFQLRFQEFEMKNHYLLIGGPRDGESIQAIELAFVTTQQEAA
jgi:hypothetical protein